LSDRHRKHPETEKKPADPSGPASAGQEEEILKTEEERKEKEPSVVLSAGEYRSLLGQIQELKDRYLRTAADFDNFRKREEKERQNIVCYANEKLVGDLLPILDNLERALAADTDGTTVEGILEGVHLVRKQLHSVLEACGLEPVEALGAPFDPMIHEAVGVLPSETQEEGTVVSELQKGYRLKGKVLRHSVVHVAGRRSGNAPGGEEQ